MQHQVEKFTVKDRWGKEHSYELHPASPDELIEIAVLLNTFAAEPIAEGLQALARSKDKVMDLGARYMRGEFEGMTNEDLLEFASNNGLIEDLLGNLNMSQITSAVRAGLMVPGMISRLRPLFSSAFRDGRSLSTPAAYDEAYMRNYVELFKVAWHIINYEGLLVFLDIASDSEAETTDSSTVNQSDSQENMMSTGGA